jgi:hypothetical protein
LTLTTDRVYGGFAVGGSTAAESFPVPALRLRLKSGDDVLLDRGSFRKLAALAERISERVAKPFEVDPELQVKPATSQAGIVPGQGQTSAPRANDRFFWPTGK